MFFKFNGGLINLIISVKVNLITKLLYFILKLRFNRLNPYTAA